MGVTGRDKETQTQTEGNNADKGGETLTVRGECYLHIGKTLTQSEENFAIREEETQPPTTLGNNTGREKEKLTQSLRNVADRKEEKLTQSLGNVAGREKEKLTQSLGYVSDREKKSNRDRE